MWLIKGLFLSLWLFGFGTIAFLYFAVFRPVTSNKATAVSVITSYTTQNFWWWTALAACIALGLALVRSYPSKGPVALWVALIVTSVVPAGFIGIFIFLAAKLREAAGAGR